LAAVTLTVISWLWGNRYTRQHAARMKSMLARHLTIPHEFHLIRGHIGEKWPARDRKALRRLQMLDPALFPGETVLQLDIDCVITGNIDHLVTDDPVKIWKCPSMGARGYALNPSVMLVKRGALDWLWHEVKADPMAAMLRAKADGWTGTDQAVLGYALDHKVATYGEADGIYSWRDMGSQDLPDDARMVHFYGPYDPAWVRRVPWVREHWR
jgi:hypothetical protein